MTTKTQELQRSSVWGKASVILREAKTTFREKGFRGVIHRYGWKFFAAFFCYYLVRDLTLYVAIPWLVARHFIN